MTHSSRERLRSRPPLQRMLQLHQAIQSGRFPTATQLARELEVSRKTVYRDLEFMRDRLGLPLEFDPHRGGFHYTEEVSAFPTLQITEGELLALVVAEKALQQYRGSSFEKPLMSALKKMAQALPESISLNLSEAQESISFRTRAEPILGLDVLDTLAKATAARQQLRLRYRKPGQSQTESRLLDPYHLANINGEWFLFAYDHLRKDIRTFVPARIKGIEFTGRTFTRPQKFSLEQRLRDSFGVYSGQGQFDVVIHFKEQVADFIREKKWHDSQQLSNLPNGGVELRLNLSGLTEVERWVLSWGGNARVVRPPELAQAVRRAAEEILQA
jgi:predicted DNA-binding transcriptional regulator YafY